MGRGGRGRHTVKTGGAAKIHRKQEEEEESDHGDDLDDDVLRFDQDDDDSSSSSDSSGSVQGVLDIDDPRVEDEKEDGSSSDKEEDSESSEEDDDMQENGIPSEEEEDEDEEEINVRDWGSRRSMYYNGDTADLEIGQEDQDAYDEEEAAKEVEATRFQSMTDEDFLLSDTEEDPKSSRTKSASSIKEDTSISLSSKEARSRLNEDHPELLPILSHFSQTAAEYHNGTRVAVKAILQSEEGTAESIGTNKAGIQYLLTKALLEASTSLHLAVYMLLKHEEAASGSQQNQMPTHPIVSRLAGLNKLLQTVDDISDQHGLREQMNMVVKAAASLQGGEHQDDEDDDSEAESDGESNGDANSEHNITKSVAAVAPVESAEEDSDTSDSSEDEAVSRSVLNEARFGLRPGELAESSKPAQRRAVRSLDAGDTGSDDGNVMKRLATTVNSIKQRKTSLKEKRNKFVDGEHIDELDTSTADYGGGGIDFEETHFRRPIPDAEPVEGGDDDLEDFYSKAVDVSKKRKQAKQEIYGAQPKFPRVERDVNGERAVSRQILKNRGLVAHKNKINRNPRVKKREKYRKANIKRHGAVRSVRTNEGHRYAGEETGVKSTISRSRKLA